MLGTVQPMHAIRTARRGDVRGAFAALALLAIVLVPALVSAAHVARRSNVIALDAVVTTAGTSTVLAGQILTGTVTVDVPTPPGTRVVRFHLGGLVVEAGPPFRWVLDTTTLPDGAHVLMVEAFVGDRVLPHVVQAPFTVSNGISAAHPSGAAPR
jgi:hypothetical protein